LYGDDAISRKVVVRCPECKLEFTIDLKDFKHGLYIGGCPRCGYNEICEDDIIDWNEVL